MKLGTQTRKSKRIDVYKLDGTLLGTFTSFSNAARATGVKIQNIYKTCNGYKTSLNGYYFKFSDEKN